MQAQLVASLPDTADVLRETKADDGSGGHTLSWDVHATVPCRIAPFGRSVGTEGEMVSAVQSQTVWTGTVPAGTDVTTKDRLLVGGRTFSITAVEPNHGWDLAVRLALELLS
jgi:hypothetical protein